MQLLMLHWVLEILMVLLMVLMEMGVGTGGQRWVSRMIISAGLFTLLLRAAVALQIQCYQCEEVRQDDCSSPEFIVNCTVNVQDMCQKEVLIMENGIHYRKSCASSGACLIASSGYQQFCTGKLNSVCITCCNTPLCNGPRKGRRPPTSKAPPFHPVTQSLILSSILSVHLYHMKPSEFLLALNPSA